MLFHVFQSQEERRAFGGSAFIEMQFCRLPADTGLKTVTAVSSIRNWQNDSLYINDFDLFYLEYCHIFDGGYYNNLKTGPVDLFGINYYPPAMMDSIIGKIMAEQPIDHEILLNWLAKAKEYNGIYILGV